MGKGKERVGWSKVAKSKNFLKFLGGFRPLFVLRVGEPTEIQHVGGAFVVGTRRLQEFDGFGRGVSGERCRGPYRGYKHGLHQYVVGAAPRDLCGQVESLFVLSGES